jgi:eight-cysteine-cluster-containing protein
MSFLDSKKNLTILLTLLSVGVIVSLVLGIFLTLTRPKVTSFDECANTSGIILESYPAECIYEGKTYVQELTDEEKKNLVPPEDEYYGYSTFGTCSSDSDCVVNGCNAEICGNKSDENISSICIAPNQPLPSELGYQCKCVQAMCEWEK